MNANIMNRRSALRTMLYIAGGTMILPACFRESGNKTINLINFTITEQQELILAELVETIVPESQTPGAKSLLLHLFVLKMVDDCHSPLDQNVYCEGLREFSALREGSSGKIFLDLSAEDKHSFLNEQIENSSENIKTFFSTTKNRCIQGYLNSKNVMSDLRRYELIPGRYIPYYRVS